MIADINQLEKNNLNEAQRMNTDFDENYEKFDTE